MQTRPKAAEQHVRSERLGRGQFQRRTPIDGHDAVDTVQHLQPMSTEQQRRRRRRRPGTDQHHRRTRHPSGGFAQCLRC